MKGKESGRKVTELIGVFEQNLGKSKQKIKAESGRKQKEIEWMKVVGGTSVTREGKVTLNSHEGKELKITSREEIRRKSVEGKAQKMEGGDVRKQRKLGFPGEMKEEKEVEVLGLPSNTSGNSS